MSHKQNRTHPYIQKINLDNNKKIRRKPPKLCYNCKETIDCVKLVSNKVDRIEGIVNNLKNPQKKKSDKLSKFNAKFTLNCDADSMEVDDPFEYSHYCSKYDPMEVDDSFEYAFYCSSKYDPMELD
jgi:hypothetical protein